MAGEPLLIDTHCHLGQIDGPAAVDALLAEAQRAGVGAFIDVGFDEKTNLQALAVAERCEAVYCTQGVHPHEAQHATEELFAQIEVAAPHPRVVAIGEMGLDYFKQFSPLETQHTVFERQLAIAKRVGLPVIIHSRDAAQTTYDALKAADLPQGGVMHCYTYDAAWGTRFIDLGYDISFSGILTFKNATDLHEAARVLPLESLHVETDAPWLAPQPHRGGRNEPAYVRHTAAALAALRGMPVESLAAQLWANAQTRFPKLRLETGRS